MSTNLPILELAAAEEFFREMGVPFEWRVDPVTGDFHAWALVDDVPPAREVRSAAAPAGRRRRVQPW